MVLAYSDDLRRDNEQATLHHGDDARIEAESASVLEVRALKE